MTMTTKIEGKCDICTKPDGTRGHNLQQCRECKVLVHELCYGMVPTDTKDANFVCHACKAVTREEGIEVNVPSKLGGVELKDVFANKEGIDSFWEFVTADNVLKGGAYERKLDFYSAISEFQNKDNDKDADHGGEEDEMWGEDRSSSLKATAQHIFDTYCANDAKKRVALPTNILSEIDSQLFNSNANGKDSAVSNTLFNNAKQHILQSLEKKQSIFKRYKQSTSFKTYLASQRIRVKQEERPMECVLCSVKHGIHAMHPLYDNHGKEARQLLLPASGAGFRRKERRLAWVHTLCAMFICSSERTQGLTYGCDENGDYETNDDDEDDEEEEDAGGGKSRVIDSDDECEEPLEYRLQQEQRKFTKCEQVFVPLMNILESAKEEENDTSRNENEEDVSHILKSIDSMVENVELLTPSFVHEYQIGQLVRRIRKSYEGSHPEVKARCKVLTSAMKRVYHEKEKLVPEGFEPVKNTKLKEDTPAKVEDDGCGNGSNENGKNTNEDIVVEGQKYKIGTTVSKEFKHGVFHGKITSFDPKTKFYFIEYSDGDHEELTEAQVSDLLLTFTAWFCITDGKWGKIGDLIKSHRELVCFICKKKDNATKSCLRIPVQCSAGDQFEFDEFRSFHRELNKRKTWARQHGEHDSMSCTTAMHVGCARWGVSDYAKVNKRELRMCYYFSGKPPTYTGPDEYTNPVSNCFCRVHAREIQEGLPKAAGTSSSARNKRKGGDSEPESDVDPDEKERRAIARKKKKMRILEESEEESD